MTVRSMRMAWKILILKRYQWVRLAIFACLFLSFLALIISTDFKSNDNIPNAASDPKLYPESLSSIRSTDFRHIGKAVYLDYTGAGMYSDAIIDQYKQDLLLKFYPNEHELNHSKETASQVSDQIRAQILQFVDADPEKYSVIFVASATQALKLVGEHFPFVPGSKYAYTRYNHNSVLGIRKYALKANATFMPLSWPPNITEIRNIEVPDGTLNLMAFPFEDNFAGTKPDPSFIKELTSDQELRKKWAIIGDVAAFLPTNKMSLRQYPVDAIVMSFYKIIGYPNTGALVISNEFAEKLRKKTYASASVASSLISENIFKLHEKMPFKLEDDSVPFEMNLAVRYGLEYLTKIGMENIQAHVWKLTQKLYESLNSLIHSTGEKCAEIYGNHAQKNEKLQGGVVAFNLKKTNGSYFGYSEVVSEASESNFHLRGGCHCNPGACFESVKLTEDKVKAYYAQKTTCGDNNDIVDGIPLGSVRASLGWASTEEDVDAFVRWVQDNYVF